MYNVVSIDSYIQIQKKREERDPRNYITGKVSSALTLGAVATGVASGRTFLPVAPAALSFFNFLIEEPCLAPSIDFFWTKNRQQKSMTVLHTLEVIYIFTKLKFKKRKKEKETTYISVNTQQLQITSILLQKFIFWSYETVRGCTLFSSQSPSLVSPSAFSDSKSKPPAFSKRSSKESSSNYNKYMIDTKIQATKHDSAYVQETTCYF